MSEETLLERLFRHSNDYGQGRTQDFFRVTLDCKEAGYKILRLQQAFDAMARDLMLRTEQVRILQAEKEHLAAAVSRISMERDNLVRVKADAHEREQRVYRRALNTWGYEAQTLMAFEEMSELQKELCKNARGRENREAIAEEIADVQIMLEQMMLLHDCAEQAADWKTVKLERLEERMDEACECGGAENESADKA